MDMTPVKPESVGFSSERLERLHAIIQQSVDSKELAGVVTILARHGKVVDYRTYGTRDLVSGVPMTEDTLFRNFSMTKPVTGVAMMILYEQGKWLPTDPIAKYIPEFADLKVFTGVDASGKMILEAPTMQELMSHTAGFTYGMFGDSPLDLMYRNQHILESKNLQDMIDKLAKTPLAFQPGKAWNYSVSMDIEGYMIEKLSGQPLPDFIHDNIYAPLGMKDAAFYVPAEKRERFAALYETTADGRMVLNTTGAGGLSDYSKQPTMPSGGGGQVSTAEDYYRFAQMLVNGGELNGVRILAPASLRLMTTNHVPLNLLTGEYSVGIQIMRPGFGYGYNCAVLYDPIEANLPVGKDTFLWDGYAGTWFWVDPANDIVFVGMTQRIPVGTPNLEYLSQSLVYQALVDPAK